MQTFSELVDSRREWIDTILKPWCLTANRINLVMAEQDWKNIAGEPAPEHTLWLWAWSRFPALCVEGLNSINETREVTVTTRSGSTFTGFPDARESVHGDLVIALESGELSPPISIDDVVEVSPVTA